MDDNIENSFKIEFTANLFTILGKINLTIRNMSYNEDLVIKNKNSIHFASDSLHNMRYIGTSLLSKNILDIKDNLKSQISFVEIMLNEEYQKNTYNEEIDPILIKYIKDYLNLCELILSNIEKTNL